MEALGEQEGYQRVQGAQGGDGGVRRWQGGQGLSDAHALQVAKAGPPCAMEGVAGEGQGRFDSSLPALLTADLLGGCHQWSMMRASYSFRPPRSRPTGQICGGKDVGVGIA